MAAVDIESVIKNGVEKALNKPILNGKSVLEWAEIGIQSQVVRCKDCKHWHPNTECCEKWWFGWTVTHTSPDWYCADGEVKQND